MAEPADLRPPQTVEAALLTPCPMAEPTDLIPPQAAEATRLMPEPMFRRNLGIICTVPVGIDWVAMPLSTIPCWAVWTSSWAATPGRCV